MTEVHKITLMVIDHECFGADEVSTILANTRGVHANVISSETAEVEWSDDHPLNHIDKQGAAFAEMFPSPADSPAPEAWIEARRGWLRYEKARLLRPIEWAGLHQRNLAGESFDDMIDALPAPASWISTDHSALMMTPQFTKWITKREPA